MEAALSKTHDSFIFYNSASDYNEDGTIGIETGRDKFVYYVSLVGISTIYPGGRNANLAEFITIETSEPNLSGSTRIGKPPTTRITNPNKAIYPLVNSGQINPYCSIYNRITLDRRDTITVKYCDQNMKPIPSIVFTLTLHITDQLEAIAASK